MTRQEVIERLKSIKSLVDKYDDVMALREAIKALEQEPKIGHWIHHKEVLYESVEHWECSNCHKSTMTDPAYPYNDFNHMYFCPKCGAKMVEPQESNK